MGTLILRSPEFGTGTTLGALNDAVTLNLRGNSPVSVNFQITGSGATLAVTFEISTDNGTNYFVFDVAPSNNTNTRVTSASSSGLWLANYQGGLVATQVRMRVSSYTSGSLTGMIYAAQWA